MAIKVSGTTVIDDSRNLQNINNLNTTGNVYANTFYGDAGQLTNLSAGDTGIYNATASGALPDGTPVVINTDGTVSVADETFVPFEEGTRVRTGTFSSTVTKAVTYDTVQNKVVVFAASEAFVGTVSGTSISFGSAVAFTTSTTYENHAVYDPATGKHLVFFEDRANNTYPTVRVGTVSGTTISFGSKLVLDSSAADHLTLTYDTDRQKPVPVWRRTSSLAVYIQSVSISGDTASNDGSNRDLGTYTMLPSAVYDSVQKLLVIFYYRSNTTTEHITTLARVGSNYNISQDWNIASDLGLNPQVSQNRSVIYDTISSQIIYVYKNGNDSNRLYAVAGTVGTTSNSDDFGTPVQLMDQDQISSFFPMVVDPNTQKVIIAISSTYSTDKVILREITVNGKALSVESVTTFNDEEGGTYWFELNNIANAMDVVYDPDSKNYVYVYNASGDSYYVNTIVIQPQRFDTNLTASNFIGISGGVYANNTSANVSIKTAISDRLSNLTPGKAYYVQPNGSLQYENYSIPERLIGAQFEASFATNSQGSDIMSGHFNSDGTKWIGLRSSNGYLYQYSLSDPYNIATMSYDSVTADLRSAGPGSDETAFAWKDDGTKLYVVSNGNNRVGEFTLSTAYDLSTISYTYNNFSVNSQSQTPYGITFKPDGTKMYITDYSSSTYRIFQYTLSTPWSLSTASYDNKSYYHQYFASGNNNTKIPADIIFNADGTMAYVLGQNHYYVYQYQLSTPYDISTMSQTGQRTGDLENSYTGQQAPLSIIWNPDFTKFYLKERNYMAQFAVGTGTLSTSAFAGTSISSNTLIVKG